MAITIRRYQPADTAATARVFHEAVTRTAACYYDEQQIAAWSNGSVDFDRWNARRSSAWTLVAESAREVVGFCDLAKDGEIDMLYVHPDHGGQGIARSLVEQVLAKARSLEIPTVTVRASRAAKPVLCRFGFVADHENIANTVNGVRVPNFTMHIDPTST